MTTELLAPNLSEPATKAADFLSAFFDENEHTQAQLAVGRIAASVVGSYVKLEQSRRASQGMEAALAQQLLDAERLTEYIAAAMPHSPLVRLLQPPEPVSGRARSGAAASG